MSLQAFIAKANSLDVLRSNRYRVEIPGIDGDTCMDVTLPAETIVASEWVQRAPAVNVPYHINYDPLAVQFLNFGDNEPYRTIRNWMKKIYDEDWRFNDMETYTEDIIVHELNRQNEIVGTHTFYACYPTVAGPKTKSAASSNAPEIFSVMFAYETSSFV